MKDEKYYLVMAELILKSENLRCEITLTHDPIIALNLSLKCISELTGDTYFYEQNKNKLLCNVS